MSTKIERGGDQIAQISNADLVARTKSADDKMKAKILKELEKRNFAENDQNES